MRKSMLHARRGVIASSPWSNDPDCSRYQCPDFGEWWAKISTILITVFTGVLAFLAVLQWWAMHRQANYMRVNLDIAKTAAHAASVNAQAAADNVKIFISKERARLSVRLISAGIPEPDPLNPSVTIEISHEGFTSAFNVIGEGVVIVTDTREFPQGTSRYDIICATDDFSIRSLPSVIRPNSAPIRAIVTMRDDLSDDDRDRIREERAFLHVVGSVDYRDFLDGRCTEPFWYIWVVDSEEHEDTDPDRPPESVDLSRWEPRIPPADFGK